MDYKKIKEAYTEILNVCDKYVNEECFSGYEFGDIEDMKKKAENHLILVEWFEKYGLEIPHDRNIRGYNYMKIDDHRYFSYFSNAKQEKKNGSGKYISWEDDGKQPKDEWLFEISFSTGAYIFGQDYEFLVPLFQEFFLELKNFGAKYCDSYNHTLYFSLENSRDVYREYPNVYKKYQEKAFSLSKEIKIKKLQNELSKLTS